MAGSDKSEKSFNPKAMGGDVTSAAQAMKLAMGGSLASKALDIGGLAGVSGRDLRKSMSEASRSQADALIVGGRDPNAQALEARMAGGVAGLPADNAVERSLGLTAVGGSVDTALEPVAPAARLGRLSTQPTSESPSGPMPVNSPAALGKLLRQAREAMGLTQAAFADAAGVGRRFLSELENGKPTLELGKVMAVCSAAGVDLLAARR